jgi:hypothetical protein
VANEALPLFLDNLVPPWCAIIVSVTAVLFVGEILPSAIFTGPSKLKIAARLSKLVWLVMLLLSPLSYPLGWLLDKLIPEHDTLTSRNEVRALVDVQREIAAERGVATGEAFHEDEADLVRGALSLSSKLVVDVMVTRTTQLRRTPRASAAARAPPASAAPGYRESPTRHSRVAAPHRTGCIGSDRGCLCDPIDRVPRRVDCARAGHAWSLPRAYLPRPREDVVHRLCVPTPPPFRHHPSATTLPPPPPVRHHPSATTRPPPPVHHHPSATTLPLLLRVAHTELGRCPPCRWYPSCKARPSRPVIGRVVLCVRVSRSLAAQGPLASQSCGRAPCRHAAHAYAHMGRP